MQNMLRWRAARSWASSGALTARIRHSFSWRWKTSPYAGSLTTTHWCHGFVVSVSLSRGKIRLIYGEIVLKMNQAVGLFSSRTSSPCPYVKLCGALLCVNTALTKNCKGDKWFLGAFERLLGEKKDTCRENGGISVNYSYLSFVIKSVSKYTMTPSQ